MQVITKTNTEKILQVSRDEIIALLVKNNIVNCKTVTKNNINIYVNVPSGGDYSNCRLNIDEDCHLFVKIKTEETESMDTFSVYHPTSHDNRRKHV